MKKSNLNYLFTIVFILCLYCFLLIVNVNRPRVLVLHSYNTDFSWVTDINQSIERTLKDKPYSTRYHYMDTKRHPSQEYKEKAGIAARNVIKDWKPDVIIAVDDNAQEWVAKYFINDPEVNIIFTGVNGELDDYGYDKANNVTGILERIPYSNLKEVFLQLADSKQKRILHISDDSETSQLIDEELNSFPWDPLELTESIECKTFEDWKKAIEKYQDKADFLLVTHYHTIKRSAADQSIVDPKEIMEWTMKNSKLPAMGCWGFNVEDGGMMAVAVSPYEQGELAAKMAVDIVDKKIKPIQIPIVTNRLYVIYLREELLKKYNMQVPLMYEAFARATNHYY